MVAIILLLDLGGSVMKKTDHELKITNVAACNNGTIKNIKAILLEIANNKSNHGEG